MKHATCQPYTTVATDAMGRTEGWRAVCRRHDWKSQVWPTREMASRSGGAHKRAKRTRKVQ